MNPASHHRGFRPVMWGAIGVTFLILATVTALRLDPRITGYAVGTLVVVCLVVCAAAFWMDSRAARATARLAERVRGHSAAPAETPSGPLDTEKVG